MPELPDVETYRRELDSGGLRRVIAGVHVVRTDILDGTPIQALGRRAKGARIVETRRHGKHLFARLDADGWLTFHFGMTGRLAFFGAAADEPEYGRLRIDFADGGHLALISKRMLARVGATDDPDDFVSERELGPDALAIDRERFVALFDGRRGAIKSALMDQALIAGIGNVYSDEILFHARLHPHRRVASLAADDLATLHRCLHRVLETAIDRGAGRDDDFPDRLPDTWLLPRRYEGATCPRCSGKVQRLKAGGRSAWLCPRCQPAESG